VWRHGPPSLCPYRFFIVISVSLLDGPNSMVDFCTMKVEFLFGVVTCWEMLSNRLVLAQCATNFVENYTKNFYEWNLRKCRVFLYDLG
jgi:hypothetical protein